VGRTYPSIPFSSSSHPLILLSPIPLISALLRFHNTDVNVHQGYQSNRNRTLSHLYTHSIPNTAFLAGDSHANWVSDLVWLDEHPYDPVTGAGAIGVEFAGTAVSSSGYGAGRGISGTNGKAKGLVGSNRELQWAEGYYRGYYELYVSPEELTARYFGAYIPAFLSFSI
jgi:alkaline phosphatase D